MKDSFYNTINAYYDDIFPLNMMQVKFVSDEFPDKNSKLIEIGCANGKLTNALSAYDIMGVDLEDSFIKIAKKRYSNVFFQSLNMLDILSLNKKFNGIVCLGNTLVHIREKQIKDFINKCYNSLEEKGKLIVQILNYENILDNEITSLPILDNVNIRFIRTYSLEDKFMFKTSLIVKASNEIIENSIELTPIRKSVIVDMFKSAGFKNIRLYGGYNRVELKNDSIPFIICGEK